MLCLIYLLAVGYLVCDNLYPLGIYITKFLSLIDYNGHHHLLPHSGPYILAALYKRIAWTGIEMNYLLGLCTYLFNYLKI